MKHLITRTLTSLTLAIVGLAVAAPAQTATKTVKATIPFEFSFGDQTFPAGDYSVTQPLQHLVALRDSRGRTIAQLVAEDIESFQPSDSTKLKFKVSEGRHILAEVWLRDGDSGLLLPGRVPNVLAKHRSTGAREAAEGSQP